MKTLRIYKQGNEKIFEDHFFTQWPMVDRILCWHLEPNDTYEIFGE